MAARPKPSPSPSRDTTEAASFLVDTITTDRITVAGRLAFPASFLTFFRRSGRAFKAFRFIDLAHDRMSPFRHGQHSKLREPFRSEDGS
jgi:hypothetical protein